MEVKLRMRETVSKGFLNIMSKGVAPGILIFNLKNKLVYMNQKACTILPALAPTSGSQQRKRYIIPREVYQFCKRLKSLPQENGEDRRDRSISQMTVRHFPSTTYTLKGILLNSRQQNKDRGSRFLMIIMQNPSHPTFSRNN